MTRAKATAVVAAAALPPAMLTAVLAARNAAEPTVSSPLGFEDAGWRLVWIGALVVAVVLYTVGVLALRRRALALGAVAAVAAAVQLLPLFAPLLLSRDVYIYWDYGRIAHVHDGNPYSDLPSDFPDDPAFRRMGEDWHGTISAYGPLWTGAAEAHAAAVGDDVDAAEIAYKLLAAAGAVALVATAALASRRAAFAAAFVGWNPLLALHFAGGGHNDGWMMAFVLGGMALARRGRPQLGGAAWAAAIAVKWLPLVLVPIEAITAWRRRERPFGWWGFAAGAAAIAAFATLLFGLAWWRAAVPISNQLQRSSSLAPVRLLEALGLDVKPATALLTVAFGVVYAVMLWRAWRGRPPRLALTLGLFCLSLAWLVPWYAAWPVALAAVEDDDRWGRALALGLTAYLLVDALPL